jgi:hypothetical protein
VIALHFAADRKTRGTKQHQAQEFRPMEARENRKPESNPEIEDENRRLRRLQIMMSMVMQVLSEQSDLTIEEASELVASSRKAALNLFPGKELAYDLIYKPRLQRVINERFRLQ